MTTYVLTDLGYGDSGKGATVDYLIREKIPITESKIVVRLQGGHQVGHTVKFGDIIHEFRNFGSGTFQGVPTYYGPETTVYPRTFNIEIEQLLPDVRPHVYCHPDTLITTKYDILVNRWQEDCRGENRHGSVGMGFNATIERNQKCQFTVHMLYANEYVIKQKLESIKNYYISLGIPSNVFTEDIIESEITDIKYFRRRITMKDFDFLFSYDNIIFEPNQGVLLDQKYGMFPHVTRSNTTASAPMLFIHDILLRNVDVLTIEKYDISRIYHTRHGAGPFDVFPIMLTNTENESNVNNQYQKEFKVSKLDLRLLDYAISINDQYWSNIVTNHTLIFTCLDQLTTNDIEFIDLEGNERSEPLEEFLGIIKHELESDAKVFATSNNPTMELTFHKI